VSLQSSQRFVLCWRKPNCKPYAAVDAASHMLLFALPSYFLMGLNPAALQVRKDPVFWSGNCNLCPCEVRSVLCCVGANRSASHMLLFALPFYFLMGLNPAALQVRLVLGWPLWNILYMFFCLFVGSTQCVVGKLAERCVRGLCVHQDPAG
jgi:hypothetical protein